MQPQLTNRESEEMRTMTIIVTLAGFEPTYTLHGHC